MRLLSKNEIKHLHKEKGYTSLGFKENNLRIGEKKDYKCYIPWLIRFDEDSQNTECM